MGLSVTPASVDERDMVKTLEASHQGLLLGDKGYIRKALNEDLAAHTMNG